MKWPFETSPEAFLEVLADRGLHILATVIFALLARWLVSRAIVAGIERAAKASDEPARTARLRTMGGLVASAIGYGIFFLALLMVLGEFGVDTKAAITAAGVFGVAIGLGAQKLVRDVIGGFFIMLENQFSVGETVTLGGPAVTGEVEEMGLRVTRLRDDVGRLIIVGNADITSVTNHSRGPLTVVVDLVLPEDTDIETVRRTVASASLSEDDWASWPRVIGLVDPPEGKIKVRVSGQAVPGHRSQAEMALRTAVQTQRNTPQADSPPKVDDDVLTH